MSSYSSHIKKFDDLRSKSVVCTGENVNVKSSEVKKVVKPKNRNKVLPELSDIEKDQIAKVDDFHEFIEGHKIDDDSEE